MTPFYALPLEKRADPISRRAECTVLGRQSECLTGEQLPATVLLLPNLQNANASRACLAAAFGLGRKDMAGDGIGPGNRERRIGQGDGLADRRLVAAVSPTASLSLAVTQSTRVQIGFGQYAQYPELSYLTSVFKIFGGK